MPEENRNPPEIPSQISETEKERPHMIEMLHQRIFCGQHGEPSRERWPEGFLVFALEGLSQLLKRDEFQSELDAIRAAAGREKSYENEIEEQSARKFSCEAAFDKRPVCCRMGSGPLMDLYKSVDKDRKDPLFPRAKCNLCGKSGLGSKYRIANRGATQYLQHACFRCIVLRMRPS